MTKKARNNGQPAAKYMLWLGNEDSLQAFLYAEEGLLHHMLHGGKIDASKLEAGCCETDSEDDEKLSRLLNIADGVGVITIHGPMTNTDSWMNRFFGLVSYNEIRGALVQAFNDESVKQIMLDFSSGGGSVAGVSDTGELIKTINKVKPITTFSDGNMSSAAYWLGSSAGTIKISNTAVVGSIGVIMRHVEYSKMLEKEGVTPTMLRAGKYKALMNSYEPLSELAKDEADKQLTHIYQVFVQNVAENLGASYPDVDAKMAQGREFVGSQALEVGLVDGISSFDQLMGELTEKAKVSAAEDNNQFYMMGSETMKKKVLSADAYAAAAASGADMTPFSKAPEGAISVAIEASNAAVTTAKENLTKVEGLATSAKKAFSDANGVLAEAGRADKAASEVEIKAEADAKAAMSKMEAFVTDAKKSLDDVTEAAAGVAESKEDAVDAAVVKVTTASDISAKVLLDAGAAAKVESPESSSSEGDAGLVGVLEKQLATANGTIVDLRVENSKLSSSLDTANAGTDGLSQIARDSINKMQVALGGSVVDLSALSGKDLVAAHAKSADDFKATFKVGPVASTELDESEGGGSGKAAPTAEHNAAVGAASSASQK